MVIEAANENGDLLDDQFKTKADFKNFIVSLSIRLTMDNSDMELEEAFDFVMGEGAFARLKDGCWKKIQNDKIRKAIAE
jgi:hypothetical protein